MTTIVSNFFFLFFFQAFSGALLTVIKVNFLFSFRNAFSGGLVTAIVDIYIFFLNAIIFFSFFLKMLLVTIHVNSKITNSQ